jgi:hypothetical protein
MTSFRSARLRPVASAVLVGIASLGLLAGCATPSAGGNAVTASDISSAKVTDVGFLSAPGQLKPSAAAGGALCWRQAKVDWHRYDKVMFERIQVYLTPTPEQRAIDPTDLKTLVDYFHKALVDNMRPVLPVVDKPGPGVLRVRIALTSLTPTNTTASMVGTAVPYGFIAEAGSGAASGRPAGSTPYMGQTGIQMQFRDGATGQVMGECADSQIGLKYAADLKGSAPDAVKAWTNGYLSSFESWTYAQDAFNKWAALFASRFAALRSGQA